MLCFLVNSELFHAGATHIVSHIIPSLTKSFMLVCTLGQVSVISQKKPEK